MAHKYEPLTRFLESADFDVWETTFEEIETALGAGLPVIARTYHEWWDNRRDRRHSMAWLSAGWEATDLDLNGERITFRRIKTAG